ncbi:hypothetical protein [Komagataeibacter oboediens]|uniref:hypothetical protein n=1 Tax=Komagataeibacter oboediens TaxID=65958 RepID=UPI001C2D09AE|nr:hypothetical protein [Komagataeibacter oboediens]MBV1824825.1 hypothetical protein [Komagataeibacter oboediens]
MTVHGGLLFFGGFDHRASLADVLRHNLDTGVRAEVARLTDADFRAYDDTALAAKVAVARRAEPIILRTAESVGGANPARVKVNDFFSGQVEVDGLDVTKTIPFDGDPQLFDLRPNQFDLNPPRGEVRGRKLIIGMGVRESESETAVRHIEATLAAVETYLSRQADAIDAYNAALPGAALSLIQQRRGTFGAASDIASRLSGR